MFEGDAGLLAEFVSESTDNLSEIEADLLAIEEGGAHPDPDLVNRVFRSIHTIKGTSGFLGLQSIGELAHSMENLLSQLRNRTLVATSRRIESLLRSADLLKRLVADVENSNSIDVSSLVNDLDRVASADSDAATAEIDHEGRIAHGEVAAVPQQPQLHRAYTVSRDAVAASCGHDQNILELEFDLAADTSVSVVDCLQRLKDTGTVLDSYVDDSEVSATHEAGSIPWRVLHATVLDADQTCRFFDLPSGRVTRFDIESLNEPCAPNDGESDLDLPLQHALVQPEPMALTTAEPAAPTVPANPRSGVAETSERETTVARKGGTTAADANVRVSVTILDRLMNLAGELVLARNQLLQASCGDDRRALDSVVSRIDQVTSDLQESIMQTRMQPIGNVFTKFTRVVRDLSKTLGKECRLEMEGKDVELDKTIIESISDPLTHLVRNSLDHGLETPEVRTQKGKNPCGAIHLRAAHQEGKVLLSISDDGAGIDPERIRRKAVEKGVISAEQAQSLSDRDAVQLIFAPGFSTAEQVTAVSGRGVGMDVVKTNFERLGGVVEIDSVVGQGTTILVRLPLTMAIIPSLITSMGGQRFAIPQGNISELVRIRSEDYEQKILKVDRSDVLRLRGALLPLVRLENTIGSSPSPQNTEVPIVPRVTNVVVVEVGRLRYGLVLDYLHDSEEIVIKPLGRHLKDVQFLAGATVLGDGSVAMILDPAGLAARAGLNSAEQNSRKETSADAVREAETLRMLLFTNHPTEWFGIPMSVVTRIERIRTEQIDSVGGQQVLQYRGGTLPLISLENCLRTLPRDESARLHVIVFNHGSRELGLIVPAVFDIRDVPADLDTHTFEEPGVLGSRVVDGHTVRFLEAFELGNQWLRGSRTTAIASAGQATNTHDPAPRPNSPGNRTPVILYAEDSNFFRKKVVSFLEQEGWQVLPCEDGRAAWNRLCEPNIHVDLVLTDVEMPNLNGFELCEQVRNSSRWSRTPVVAVTSLADDADRERGARAGVTEYLVKIDRNRLLEVISRHLGVPLSGRTE